MMSKSIVSDLIQIFRSSVSAVLPENLIRKSLKYNPGDQQLNVLGEEFCLRNKNVYLVGTGKAVQNMAIEVESILSPKIKYGIVSIPEGSLNKNVTLNNVHYYEGAKNNLPDVKSETAARKINDLIIKLDSNDLLLVLISGGGSALLPLPKEPITLEEKTVLIKKLANAGADITELNTVRKRLSDLKGGQMAIKAQPAQVVSLILSDIVGDPLDLIASGPTVENKDEPNRAINIINKYNKFDYLPESIKSILNENIDSQMFPEKNVHNQIIGSNKLSIDAALNESQKLNYFPLPLSNAVTGNVKDIANKYMKLVKAICDFINRNSNLDDLKRQIEFLNIPGVNTDFLNQKNNLKDRYCLILGGEITVKVKGKGKGGRNQQLALEFSKVLHYVKEDLKNFEIYFLSAGTDGIDGPTDAAGGIGYLNLVSDSKEYNIDVEKYLENNDSYNFYKNFRNGNLHVITGHTYTNVMDIHLIIIKKN